MIVGFRISEVPNEEGYFVDNYGNVYSQWVNRGKHGVVKSSELKLLKTSVGKTGYKTVRFGRKGKAYLVHILVYEVFEGRVEDGLYVCHKDGNSLNNSLSNLYCGTQSQNMSDTLRHGRCNFSKLDEVKVKEILVLKETMLVKDIAFLYGVDRHSITNIFQNKSWKHIERS